MSKEGKTGRPRKINDELYEKVKSMLGGHYGGIFGNVTERTVRNWIQVEPLVTCLVETFGREKITHYFSSRQKGKRAEGQLSMKLLLAISRLPQAAWVIVSKKAMEDIDEGMSHTRASECVKAHLIFEYKKIRAATRLLETTDDSTRVEK